MSDKTPNKRLYVLNWLDRQKLVETYDPVSVEKEQNVDEIKAPSEKKVVDFSKPEADPEDPTNKSGKKSEMYLDKDKNAEVVELSSDSDSESESKDPNLLEVYHLVEINKNSTGDSHDLVLNQDLHSSSLNHEQCLKIISEEFGDEKASELLKKKPNGEFVCDFCGCKSERLASHIARVHCYGAHPATWRRCPVITCMKMFSDAVVQFEHFEKVHPIEFKAHLDKFPKLHERIEKRAEASKAGFAHQKYY